MYIILRQENRNLPGQRCSEVTSLSAGRTEGHGVSSWQCGRQLCAVLQQRCLQPMTGPDPSRCLRQTGIFRQHPRLHFSLTWLDRNIPSSLSFCNIILSAMCWSPVKEKSQFLACCIGGLRSNCSLFPCLAKNSIAFPPLMVEHSGCLIKESLLAT